MREIHKNIFTCTDGCIVIPTNGDTKKVNGKIVAVMGKGLAKKAAENFPELPGRLGAMLMRKDDAILNIHLFCFSAAPIICLPTKLSWKDDCASIDLIFNGLHQLKRIADHIYPQKFYLPRLGCGKGTGNLDWEQDVQPVMDAVFENDERFILVNWP